MHQKVTYQLTEQFPKQELLHHIKPPVSFSALGGGKKCSLKKMEQFLRDYVLKLSDPQCFCMQLAP